MTTGELYEFVEVAIERCREHGYADIAKELDDAMHVGTSGLETIGAIKNVLIVQAARLKKIVDKAKMAKIVKFVETFFGTLYR